MSISFSSICWKHAYYLLLPVHPCQRSNGRSRVGLFMSCLFWPTDARPFSSSADTTLSRCIKSSVIVLRIGRWDSSRFAVLFHRCLAVSDPLPFHINFGITLNVYTRVLLGFWLEKDWICRMTGRVFQSMNIVCLSI